MSNPDLSSSYLFFWPQVRQMPLITGFSDSVIWSAGPLPHPLGNSAYWREQATASLAFYCRAPYEILAFYGPTFVGQLAEFLGGRTGPPLSRVVRGRFRGEHLLSRISSCSECVLPLRQFCRTCMIARTTFCHSPTSGSGFRACFRSVVTVDS